MIASTLGLTSSVRLLPFSSHVSSVRLLPYPTFVGFRFEIVVSTCK